MLIHRLRSITLFLLGIAIALPGFAQSIALVGGTLLDGTGARPLPDSVVLINGTDIVAVGTVAGMAIPEEYEIISTEGMTLLPGLWDTSVQLLYDGHPDLDHWLYTYPDQAGSIIMPAIAGQLLQAGVTGIRDTGARAQDILALRQAIIKGEVPGPKVFAAGPILVPTKGPVRPHMIAVDGEAQAVSQTRALIKMGVDLIRVAGADYDDQDEMDAIVKTAHRNGLRVVANASSDAEVRTALLAGADELLHIGTQTMLYSPEIMTLIEERVQHGPPLYWNPLVGQILNAAALAQDHEWLDDPANFAGLPESMARDIQQAVAQYDFCMPAPEYAETLKRKLEQLRSAGVTFVFGSDTGQLGQPAAQATWRELNTWVSQLGMPAEDAIRWATSESASYIGMGDITGSVVRGKKADLIAVKGNLLKNFTRLQDPVLVIRHGVRYR